MAQALVYTTPINNVVWTTDKAEIVTTANAVAYNVTIVQAGNPIVGIVGDVTAASNVMITTNAGQNLVGATFVTGPGVANTTTVVSAVNGQSLTMSANASATLAQSQYTLTTGNYGNLYVGGTNSGGPNVSPNSRQQIYVGAGNKLSVFNATDATVRAIGTASSATAGF
jgi:hypothetical protein